MCRRGHGRRGHQDGIDVVGVLGGQPEARHDVDGGDAVLSLGPIDLQPQPQADPPGEQGANQPTPSNVGGLALEGEGPLTHMAAPLGRGAVAKVTIIIRRRSPVGAAAHEGEADEEPFHSVTSRSRVKYCRWSV